MLEGILVKAVSNGNQVGMMFRIKETSEDAIASIIFEPVRMPEKIPAAKIILDTKKIFAP